MSIISTLYIDDDYKSNILRYHWSFIQHSDRSGRPSSRPTGGNIQIVLEATKSSLLAEWALDAKMMRYLKIVQSSVHNNGKSRIFEFYDAMCLQAKDDFDGVNSQPMRTFITISSPLILVNGVKVKDEYWKVTDLDAQKNVTSINNVSNLIGYYITDTEGERIKKYEAGATIILNIETENLTGKTITLNLNDKEYDFKHNGVTLKNDILKQHPISSDLEKVELEVIEPEKEEFEY